MRAGRNVPRKERDHEKELRVDGRMETQNQERWMAAGSGMLANEEISIDGQAVQRSFPQL
jgi:hypothetical protein